MRTPIGASIFIALMVALDLYFFQAIKTVTQNLQPKTKSIVYIIYWSLTAISIAGYLLFVFTDKGVLGKKTRTYLFATIIGLFLAKLIGVAVFLLDDIRRFIQWGATKLFNSNSEMDTMNSEGISRSTFISWLGIATGGGLFGSLLYGFSNKYNYQIKRLELAYNNLPKGFKGIKIIHISDIHSGSFMDKDRVEKGVQKILNEKPDIIFFTGDLVNNLAEEMDDYIDVFSKLTAPMGVYSILGNHDYADYVQWKTADEKQENLSRLIGVHKKMNWRILLDEHVELEKNGDKIGLIGVQNLSTKARFHTYGNIEKAYKGAEAYSFKILLSHDPSHWDFDETKIEKKRNIGIVQHFKDIDLMLSGHTHGMQFGVEIPGIKWSPVQYVYKQWKGLYESGNQKLYVNPGFGFIGYPGRVGMLPEITVIELV